MFFEYLQFFPKFQIFNLLQFPNIFPLLTIGPAIRANLRKVILNLQHFILKIFHSFFPLNRSDTSFPDISSFLSFLFVVPFSFDYFVTDWGLFFFLTEKINFLSTHLQTDLVPQLFGSLEGYLEQFINIFLIFYLFKHLLPLLYTLLMKFCHFAETSLSLDLERMRVDYIFHLQLEPTPLTPCTFYCQLFKRLQLFRIFFPNIIAIRTDELFGSISPPCSLNLLCTGSSQKISCDPVTLTLFSFSVSVLDVSDLQDVHLGNVSLYFLGNVLLTLDFILQLVRVCCVFYYVVFVVGHLLQNTYVSDYPRLLPSPRRTFFARGELSRLVLRQLPTN